MKGREIPSTTRLKQYLIKHFCFQVFAFRGAGLVESTCLFSCSTWCVTGSQDIPTICPPVVRTSILLPWKKGCYLSPSKREPSLAVRKNGKHSTSANFEPQSHTCALPLSLLSLLGAEILEGWSLGNMIEMQILGSIDSDPAVCVLTSPPGGLDFLFVCLLFFFLLST